VFRVFAGSSSVGLQSHAARARELCQGGTDRCQDDAAGGARLPGPSGSPATEPGFRHVVGGSVEECHDDLEKSGVWLK
jgi:hypothetical protein